MLSAIRRLCLGAGNAASRGMSSATVTAEEQLFACLFPGQGRYSPDRAAQLAGKLREVADSLSHSSPQQEEKPRERESKRRRKERRYGKGEGSGGRRQWRAAAAAAAACCVPARQPGAQGCHKTEEETDWASC